MRTSLMLTGPKLHMGNTKIPFEKNRVDIQG